MTDRSGYSDEVSLGGLTGFEEQISIHADVWDNPTADESVVTMIHEAMHAGNETVDDKGYIGSPSFTELSAATKLTNAAHFEVVPRRILDAEFAFAGITFVPAGTGGTPALTPRQQAVRDASEMFREAWTLGLNLHMLYVNLVRSPREWRTFEIRRRLGGVGAGLKWADTLPFWSKVMKLTIHERTAIDPTSADPSRQPVTRIDVALSEGVVRKAFLDRDGRGPRDGGRGDRVPEREGDRRGARGGDHGRHRARPADAPGAARAGRLDRDLQAARRPGDRLQGDAAQVAHV